MFYLIFFGVKRSIMDTKFCGKCRQDQPIKKVDRRSRTPNGFTTHKVCEVCSDAKLNGADRRATIDPCFSEDFPSFHERLAFGQMICGLDEDDSIRTRN